MKRLLAALLALGLFVMCGCSSESKSNNDNIMYVVGDAYNLTPQEYIDLVNQTLDNEDLDYPKIPDWDNSKSSIKIGSFFTRLYFDTNDEGKITNISYHWETTQDQQQVDAAYFLAGLTISMISLEHTSEIEEELDMLRAGKSSYINECDMDGSHFHYTCTEYGKHNHLSISLSSESQLPSDEVQPESEEPVESLPDETPDERGIVGMNATAILLMAQSTFDVPYSKKESNVPEYSAYTCVSNGEKDGVIYDYSISLDSDSEIIGASFGVSSSSVSETELFYAADLYFYAVSLISYDTADTEALSAWFEESLPTASSEATSITIGDAKFELYGTNGGMYWLDISKAS